LALRSFDLVLVRESDSYRILDGIKVKTPKVLTYDTSFLFGTQSTIARTEDELGLTIGVSLGLYGLTFSEIELTELAHSYACFLDNLVDKFGLFPIFVPNYVSGFQYDDLHFSKMIITMMRKKDNVRLIETRNADELNMIIAKMSLMISSKMHPCAIALSNCIPTLCIAYDHKQTGLFESLGLSEYVVLLTESSSENLLSVFALLWHNRHQIREHLAVSVPKIRKDVDKEIRFALSVAYRDSKN
jgi:colanic acid/amylovoran biosynthesis protein